MLRDIARYIKELISVVIIERVLSLAFHALNSQYNSFTKLSINVTIEVVRILTFEKMIKIVTIIETMNQINNDHEKKMIKVLQILKNSYEERIHILRSYQNRKT